MGIKVKTKERRPFRSNWAAVVVGAAFTGLFTALKLRGGLDWSWFWVLVPGFCVTTAAVGAC